MAEGRILWIVHHIGNQPTFAIGFLTRHDQRLLYRVVLRKQGFYLTQFNPETADLDLMIDPAKISDIEIVEIPAQVAGAVQSITWHAGKRVGNKTLGCEHGVIQISSR